MTPAVEVVDLVKRYGDQAAVAGLSLTVQPGSITAILGPNGAGKTTTVETCEGYRRPDSGGVRVLGRHAELGSMEAGKLADVALWRVDGFGHDVIDDPVVALAFGPVPPLEHLLVGGRTVVERDELRTVSRQDAAEAGRAAHRRLTKEVTR